MGARSRAGSSWTRRAGALGRLAFCGWRQSYLIWAPWLHFPPVPGGRVRSWPSFRLAPDRTEGRSRSRSFSRVRAPGLLTVTGWPAVTDGLDGDLARLQEWPRREDGPVRVRVAGLRRSADAVGALESAPAAAAVATALRRAAARVVRRVPRRAPRARLLLER